MAASHKWGSDSRATFGYYRAESLSAEFTLMLANVGGARSLWAASCRNAAVEIPEGTLMPMSLSFFRSCGRVSRDGWLHATRGGCRCCTIERVVYFDFLFVLTIAIWFNMLLRTIKESENEMRYCNYRWSSKALIRDHELPLVPSHQQVFLAHATVEIELM